MYERQCYATNAPPRHGTSLITAWILLHYHCRLGIPRLFTIAYWLGDNVTKSTIQNVSETHTLGLGHIGSNDLDH